MITNDYYTDEHHGDWDMISIGRLELEEGGVIEDCQLAVVTMGELNDARDNAILVTTWYSGTHQIWRTNYIGADHAPDPSRYFIVCVNQIGNGLSTSPHNTDDDSISMSKFPKVRIGDDVVAQERLLRELAAALGRITATTFVMPIDEDMFFPPRDCQAEADLVPDAEFRVINDVLGHLGLFDVNPEFMPQVDAHLRDLLATSA